MAFNGEIYEIFSWLSPPLLHEISRKSKPCSEFLLEIPFIEKQCRNSLLKPQEYLLIQDDSALQTKAHYLQLCPLGHSNNHNYYYRYSSMIPRKEFKDLQQNSRVVASCNGLLLCQTSHFPRPTRYFLCNPATRNIMYVESPADHEDMSNASSLVFLCGNSNKFPLDYTLLLFNPLPTWSNYCNVYVLEGGKNNWELKKEKLVIGPGNVDFQNPVHCTDGLYFMSDAGFIRPRDRDDYTYQDCIPYYVLHYEIQRGTSRIVGLPDEARTDEDDDHVKMGIFGWEKSNYYSNSCCFRSICLVKIKLCEIVSIWTLDVGRGSKLWWRESFVMKKSVVRDLGIKGFKSWQPSFAIIEKKLVMVAGKYVYSYCLEGKEQGKARTRRVFKINDELGERYRFDSYTSTLRPCTNQT